jgi:hypothetical protein
MTLFLVVTFAVTVKAQSRNWQTGTLLETEQQKVLEGSTTNRTSSGRGNGGNYSGDSTTSKTDNYDTYQVFTISSGQTTMLLASICSFPGPSRRLRQWELQ